MKAYRCQICGHVHFGDSKATHCPFCGVSANYIVNSAEYVDYGKVENISEKTKQDLYKALRYEYEDMIHYRRGSMHAKSNQYKAILDTMSDHEERHAHAIEEMLGLEEGSAMPVNMEETLEKPITDSENHDEEVFEKGMQAERNAVKFYSQIANETDNPRVKMVFHALAEVEYQHSLIDKMHC